MKNEVLYIAALNKTQRIAEWIDQLKTAREKVAKGVCVSIYQKDIDAIAPALAAEGVAEDAKIESAPVVESRRDNRSERSRSYSGNTYLSEIDAAGDINKAFGSHC